MPTSAPRVAIIGVWLESNRFAPVAKEADFKSFYQLEGEEILAAARDPHPYILGEASAFVKTMDATGPWEPVPILLAACHPAGCIDGRLMDDYLARMRAGLEAAGPLDAVVHDDGHGDIFKLYVTVFAALAVATGISFGAYELLGQGTSSLVIIMIVSLVKATLVAYVFMHLK